MKKAITKLWSLLKLLVQKVAFYIHLFFKKIWKLRKTFYLIPIALLLSISQNISTRSQLEFSFSGIACGPVENNEYYQCRHGGLIKNKSKEKNTITRINLLVWVDDSREHTLRDGFGPSWMVDNKTGEEIKLPLVIEGREAVDVDIFNKFLIEGTADEDIVYKRKSVVPGSPFTIPKLQKRFFDEGNIY